MSIIMSITEIKSIKDFMEALDTTDLSPGDPNKKPLMVIDCYGTWCGKCKAIAPKYEEFSQQYTQAAFYKVDVDNVEDVAMELGVKVLPTFVFFQDGAKVAAVVGASAEKIQETIVKFLE